MNETLWHSIKVYAAPHEQDTVLERLVEVARDIPVLAQSPWFFIRYSDYDECLEQGESPLDTPVGSGAHLRLRFNIPSSSIATVNQAVASATGPSTDMVVKKYVPETDRYGGPEGMAVAHDIFCADTRVALALTAIDIPEGIAPLVRIISAQDFLDALHISERAQTRVYQRQCAWIASAISPGPRPLDVGQLARERLRVWVPQLERARAIITHSRQYQDALLELRRPGEYLQLLEQHDELTQPFETILASLQHMHFNRVGITPRQEASAVPMLAEIAR